MSNFLGGFKQILSKTNFGEKNKSRKKLWVQKIYPTQKKFWFKNSLGANNFEHEIVWVRIFLGPKNIFGSKILGLNIFESKKFGSIKIFKIFDILCENFYRQKG